MFVRATRNLVLWASFLRESLRTTDIHASSMISGAVGASRSNFVTFHLALLTYYAGYGGLQRCYVVRHRPAAVRCRGSGRERRLNVHFKRRKR